MFHQMRGASHLCTNPLSAGPWPWSTQTRRPKIVRAASRLRVRLSPGKDDPLTGSEHASLTPVARARTPGRRRVTSSGEMWLQACVTPRLRRRSYRHIERGGTMAKPMARIRGGGSINSSVIVAILLPFVAGYAALFTYAMQHTSYDVWGALWLAPVLVTISAPILLRYAKREPNPWIGQILMLALVLKLGAALPRYYMVASVYERGDALRYSRVGIVLRPHFVNLDFSVAQLGEPGSGTGTRFVEIVTGLVYAIIGPSVIGGFIFFSWLSFWGLFFFFRAFRIGFPEGDATRYALLLFLLPSMLFWPSSIGKEAWMTLVLGITTYGCALLLARRRGASAYLAVGTAGVLAVRPHMALLTIAGLALAYVLRAGGAQRVVSLGRTRTIVGLAVIGVGTLLVIRKVSEFFGIDEFNLDTATETLDYAEGQTSQGGSEFAGGGASVRNLPMNIVTVLFRPFAFEVNNLQALLAALEGTMLMVLFVLSIPRLRTIPRRLRKQPYVTYCVTYSVLFCFMFSAFQNFGILARQRVLVFPLVLVLLALPLAKDESQQQRHRRASVVDHAVAATRE